MKLLLLFTSLIAFYSLIAQKTVIITLSRSANKNIVAVTKLNNDSLDTKNPINFIKGDKITVTAEPNLKDYKVQIFNLDKNNPQVRDSIMKELSFLPKTKSFTFNIDENVLIKYNDSINTSTYGDKIRLVITDAKDKTKSTSIDLITVDKKDSDGTATKDENTLSLPFVDTTMILSVSKTGACDSCLFSAYIRNHSERKFSTDYFITFDASRKLDDYTICKHIYKKNNASTSSVNRLKEMYRKVSPAWFAPHVGSQLKFQVVNQPLSDQSKIVVNETDLFIDNSAFQSVVSNQLTLTLLNSARNTTVPVKVKDSIDTATGKAIINSDRPKDETLSAKLSRLFNELNAYTHALIISPCTLADNRTNLIVIKSRIQVQFATSVDVLNDLVKKFDTGANEKSIALAVKNIITGLDTLKPLVYSTARLVNRDFINIKVINGNNETIADENIRTSFGLKIDYSAGVFLTGLRDDSFIFFDTTVRYKPDSSAAERDTAGNYIRKQTAGKLNVGFGVLVHAYPRISSNYNIGITTGFMATTNLDLNILLGGSFMIQSLFGTNNRLVFSGGVAWGKVKRLSTAYQEGYHTSHVADPNHPTYSYDRPVFYTTTGDPTVQVWRRSGFFSITYNFR